MDWAKPENIIWLIFIPVFIGLAVYIFRWRKKTRALFADSNLVQQLFPENSKSKYWSSVVLICSGILFAVFALMDPLFGDEQVKVKREGIDIVYSTLR